MIFLSYLYRIRQTNKILPSQSFNVQLTSSVGSPVHVPPLSSIVVFTLVLVCFPGPHSLPSIPLQSPLSQGPQTQLMAKYHYEIVYLFEFYETIGILYHYHSLFNFCVIIRLPSYVYSP